MGSPSYGAAFLLCKGVSIMETVTSEQVLAELAECGQEVQNEVTEGAAV